MNVEKAHMGLVPRVEPPVVIPPPPPPGPSTALLAVQNIAALEALDDTTFVDGTYVAMRSLLIGWRLIFSPSASTVVDGITVVSSFVGGGRVWVRDTGSNPEWLDRDTWWVDSTTGNNENTGLTGPTALADFAELARRWAGEPLTPTGGTVTINWAGPYTGPDLVITPSLKGVTMNVVGPTPTLLYGGSATAGTVAANPAAGTTSVLKDSAIPVSWTASGLVKKFIQLTSGANMGAGGWSTKDLGGVTKSCQFTPFWNPGTFSAVAPAVGDQFKVYDLAAFNASVRISSDDGFITFTNFSQQGANRRFEVVGGSAVVLQFCENITSGFGPVQSLAGSFLDFAGTHMGSGTIVQANPGGQIEIDASFVERTVEALGGIIESFADTDFYCAARSCLRTDAGGVLLLGSNIGMFDSTAQDMVAVGIGCPPSSISVRLWGAGNAGATHFVTCDSGGYFIYRGANPFVPGGVPAGTVCRVGATDLALAALPFTLAGPGVGGITTGQFI